MGLCIKQHNNNHTEMGWTPGRKPASPSTQWFYWYGNTTTILSTNF